MIKYIYLVVAFFTLLAGCGQKKSLEETLSKLNTEADRWDGGESFKTSETDGWGKALYWKITEGKVLRDLTVGSSGPDGLPKNSDDITAMRSKTVFTIKGAAKAAAGGVAEGAIVGVKAGFDEIKASKNKETDKKVTEEKQDK